MDSSAPLFQNLSKKQLNSLAISILEFYKDGHYAHDPDAKRQKDSHNTIKCNLIKVLEYNINTIPDKKMLGKEYDNLSRDQFINRIIKMNIGPFIEPLHDRAKLCDEEWVELIDCEERRVKRLQIENEDLKKTIANYDTYCQVQIEKEVKSKMASFKSEKEDVMVLTNKMIEAEDTARRHLREKIELAGKLEKKIAQVESTKEQLRLDHASQREGWEKQLQELATLKQDKQKFELEKIKLETKKGKILTKAQESDVIKDLKKKLKEKKKIIKLQNKEIDNLKSKIPNYNSDTDSDSDSDSDSD
jgi:hypothetical protein